MNEHDRLVDRAAHEARTVLFVGGLDSGKSSMARAVAAYALRLGRSVAYLDADVSQKTVGPPGTVGLKHIRDADDLTRSHGRGRRDRVRGVDVAPGPPAAARGRALAPARARPRRGRGARRRGHGRRGLPDPGAAREVLQGRHAGARPRGRAPARRGARADRGSWSGSSASRWSGSASTPASCRPRSTSGWRSARSRCVATSTPRSSASGCAPRCSCRRPPLFDLSQLDRLLVGLSDGEGAHGIGYLEPVSGNGGLRPISPVADPPKALRLGSVRLEESFREAGRPPNLFGTE